jgi:hypothetical protein
MQNKKKCRACEKLLDITEFEKTEKAYKNKCKKCERMKESMWNNKPKGYNWLLGYSLGERR